ncbi:hypothetical protein [Halocatena marina]|uniref:hypothetical protein n=1 Tax=Halocatena marina TaxID=2934937 RepID=UPI00200BA82F|nr:hypothetical protein [Halocatena marina]
MKPSTSTQEYTTVQLPTKSVAVLEERVRSTEFDSVSAYLTFLIDELAHQTDNSDDAPDSQQAKGMDDEAIEQRLRSLGYLDN